MRVQVGDAGDEDRSWRTEPGAIKDVLDAAWLILGENRALHRLRDPRCGEFVDGQPETSYVGTGK